MYICLTVFAQWFTILSCEYQLAEMWLHNPSQWTSCLVLFLPKLKRITQIQLPPALRKAAVQAKICTQSMIFEGQQTESLSWWTSTQYQYLQWENHYPAGLSSFRIEVILTASDLQWSSPNMRNMLVLIKSCLSAPDTRALHLNPSTQSLSIYSSVCIDSSCQYIKRPLKFMKGV